MLLVSVWTCVISDLKFESAISFVKILTNNCRNVTRFLNVTVTMENSCISFRFVLNSIYCIVKRKQKVDLVSVSK